MKNTHYVFCTFCAQCWHSFLFSEAWKGRFDGATINLSITPTTLLKQFPFSTKGEKNAWIFPLSWPLENIPPSLQSWSTWTIIFLKGSLISTTIATNHYQFLPMIHTLRLHKRAVQLLTFEYVINIAHLCYWNRDDYKEAFNADKLYLIAWKCHKTLLFGEVAM